MKQSETTIGKMMDRILKKSQSQEKKKPLLKDRQFSPHGESMSTQELETIFTKLTHWLYDTDVKLGVLRKEVWPYLDEAITFRDPWQTTKGIRMFKVGAKGFHCSFYFDFDIYQLNVAMDSKDPSKGRCFVDGVMNLNQLKFFRGYSYPLRTQLVYSFKMNDDGTHFHILDLEEMWSFADMLHNLPLGIGKGYDIVRWILGFFFSFYFWLSCLIICRIPWSTIDK